MACALTTGRKLPCKQSVGGIRTAYFAAFGTLGTATISNGNISALAGTPAFYKYDLKGANSSLTTNIISSRDTGTTVYETTLELTFTHLDVATQEELKLLAAARPHVVIEDNNETANYFMVGYHQGAEVTAGTIVTGAAYTDLSGFTLTLTATEVIPPLYITGSVVTTLANASQIDPTA
tara:strand:+ start:1306 stop:1842 length:537 start_codon:yes stop_codon:yes gene_type:complete